MKNIFNYSKIFKISYTVVYLKKERKRYYSITISIQNRKTNKPRTVCKAKTFIKKVSIIKTNALFQRKLK